MFLIQTQLDEVKFPLQFEKPANISVAKMEDYYRCCDGYQAAIDVFTLDKAQKAADDVDADMNGNKEQKQMNGDNKEQNDDIVMNDVMKVEPAENVIELDSLPNMQSLPLPLPQLSRNELLQFTSQPLPNDSNHNHNNDHNGNISSPLQPINNDNQHTLLFGQDHNMNDDDVIGDDSSTEEEEVAVTEVQKIEIEEEKEEKKNENMEVDSSKNEQEEKEENKEEDEPVQPELSEAELKAIEEKRTMYEISERNNSKTLDILRSLDQMEESVTNKKLEKSTIEQLNINWKKHRRLQQQKDKKKNPKDAKKRARGRPRGRGRGRGSGRGRGQGRKPQPPPTEKSVVEDDDSSLSEEIDFGSVDDGAFDHLNANQNQNKTEKKSNPKEEADADDNESTVSLIDLAPKAVEAKEIVADTKEDDIDIQMKVDMEELQTMENTTTLDVDADIMNNDEAGSNINENDLEENADEPPANDTDQLLAKLDGFSAFLGGLK